MTAFRPSMRSFWPRRAQAETAVVAIDPADMGTCFGLEMCLDLPRAASDPSSPAAEPAPWWERAGARKAFGA
jgi:hypothetical protein